MRVYVRFKGRTIYFTGLGRRVERCVPLLPVYRVVQRLREERSSPVRPDPSGKSSRVSTREFYVWFLGVYKGGPRKVVTE